jgi:hypothetical protein
MWISWCWGVELAQALTRRCYKGKGLTEQKLEEAIKDVSWLVVVKGQKVGWGDMH